MKGWGYYCSFGFVVTLLASVATFFMSKLQPLIGDIATAALMLLLLVSIVAVLMSKFIGFGDAAIPREKRGIIAGIRGLSIPVSIALFVGFAYAVGILATSKYHNVKNPVPNSYYLEVPTTADDKSVRIYVSDPNPPKKQQSISEEQAFRYMWESLRIYTAVAAAAQICCAAFFFSRSARQSPELRMQMSEGMFRAQVDDTMNL